MRMRPAIGTRVQLSGDRGTGTVVAHNTDGIGLVVRLDPQKPLRRVVQRWLAFDRAHGLAHFPRRKGDWGMDPDDVRPLVPAKKRGRKVGFRMARKQKARLMLGERASPDEGKP